MKIPGFLGGSHKVKPPNYDCQQTINYYIEKSENGTSKEQEPVALIPCPGQILAHMLSKGPVRGLHSTTNGHIVCVAGNGVYYLVQSASGVWSHTLFAVLTTTAGPVSICDGITNYWGGSLNTANIDSVIIVDGSSQGILFEEGKTEVTQLNSGGNFQGSDWVTFQDGFFIFNKPGFPYAYFAEDPLQINALDFVVVNLASDVITRVISDHDILWFFGKKSTVIFQNTGGSGTQNTFAQIPGSLSTAGTNAPATVAQVSGQLLWVANDARGNGQVFMASGYRGVKISTSSVDIWLQANAANLSQATAWTHQHNGHSFYVLNVPGATTTWVYDLTVQEWTERGLFEHGVWSRDPVECHVCVKGVTHLVGDYRNGNIYTLSDELYVQNNTPMVRLRAVPHVSSSYRRVFASLLQVDVEAGVGLGVFPGHTQSGYPLKSPMPVPTPLFSVSSPLDGFSYSTYSNHTWSGTILYSEGVSIGYHSTIAIGPFNPTGFIGTIYPPEGSDWSYEDGEFSEASPGPITLTFILTNGVHTQTIAVTGSLV